MPHLATWQWLLGLASALLIGFGKTGMPGAVARNTPLMVLTVAQHSILRDQAGAFVLVVGADSKVEQRRVEIGKIAQGRAQLLSGVEEGELVIVEGVNKVRPGIVVDAAQSPGG